jgi:hypothetical protein
MWQSQVIDFVGKKFAIDLCYETQLKFKRAVLLVRLTEVDCEIIHGRTEKREIISHPC